MYLMSSQPAFLFLVGSTRFRVGGTRECRRPLILVDAYTLSLSLIDFLEVQILIMNDATSCIANGNVQSIPINSFLFSLGHKT